MAVQKWAKLASNLGFIDDYWLTLYCLWKIIQKMKTFMIILLKKNKILSPLFQTGDVVYGEWKLRDLGMVFKPKCLKNKKINFSPAFLKLETCLSYIIFAERFWLKKRKLV